MSRMPKILLRRSTYTMPGLESSLKSLQESRLLRLTNANLIRVSNNTFVTNFIVASTYRLRRSYKIELRNPLVSWTLEGNKIFGQHFLNLSVFAFKYDFAMKFHALNKGHVDKFVLRRRRKNGSYNLSFAVE